jgi:hypothetical protein
MTKLEVLGQPLYGNSNIIFIGKPIFPQILHRVEWSTVIETILDFDC